MINKVSILGCGWYGFALAKALVSAGYEVKGSTTSSGKLNIFRDEGILPFLVNFESTNASYDPEFFECDVLIISLPPRRSTPEHTEYPSRIRVIAEAALKGAVQKVIMISSTSVYGDAKREVTEADAPNPNAGSGKAIAEAEAIIHGQNGFRSTILRFGGLIGPGRNLARFFAGKTDIPNGLAPVNLLHLEDCIRITLHILDNDGFGFIFNACSPDHPSRENFYTMAAEKSGLAKPHFSSELLDWKLVNGNLISTVLNYKYLVNDWSYWLSPDKL